MDEDGSPVRLIFVRSLKGHDPEAFLRESLGYENTGTARNGDASILFTRKSRGSIPVLCFHRIGDDDSYEISISRVHHLMATLVRYGYFPISDRDFARGDFSAVPSGMKPVVMGADDAGATQLLWDSETLASYGNGAVPGRWTLDPNCLASIFSRYFSKSRGHFNFTFYISFDAVPFRQLAGQVNRGFPYEKMPVVGDKLRYAYDNYYLGHHSLTHTFREKMSPSRFFGEIGETNRIVSDYLGIPVQLPTLAYPYGSGTFTVEEEKIWKEAIRDGRFPGIAYDLNGRFSVPPWTDSFVSWNISRYSVENSSFQTLVNRLSSDDTYQSRRTVLIRSNDKNINLKDYHLELGGDDTVYVYIP